MGPVKFFSSFRRKPESSFFFFSILRSLECRASTRPVGERVTFFACAKKGNQRNTPPTARSPGILPCDCARALRGSLDVRPCTFSERAHIVCALLRTDPTHPRRASGGPGWAASCRRSKGKSHPRTPTPPGRSAGMHGFVDARRHSRCRASQPSRDQPAGSRQGIAAIAKRHRDCAV
jgi:hypothetical protein